MKKNFAIVTGASRGIGRSAALALAGCGCSILAAARTNRSALAELRKEIKETWGQECITVLGDIGREDFVTSLFSLLPEEACLKVLVNNAGISHVGLLQDMSLAQWNTLFQTNVTSMFLTCRAAIPLFLRQGGGSILNVSSVWGLAGASCEAAYSAAKGAVNSFTRALGKELAPSGIRVNAVAFGAVDTSMNQFLSPEERRALEEEIPAGRFGTPAEAGALIADLSLNHPYLTGQVITIDGAWI